MEFVFVSCLTFFCGDNEINEEEEVDAQPANGLIDSEARFSEKSDSFINGCEKELADNPFPGPMNTFLSDVNEVEEEDDFDLRLRFGSTKSG